MWLLACWAILKTLVIGYALLVAARQIERRAGGRSWLVVLVLAAGIRLVWLVVVNAPPTGDAAWYFGRASELAAGLGYQLDGHPTARLAPGWPLLLSIAYRVVGPSVLLGRLVNWAFSVATVGLVWAIAARLYDRRVASVAALATAVWPGEIPYAGVLLSEPFFGVLFLGAFWLSLRLGSTQAWRARACASGVLLGVAALTRPVALLYAPLTALVAWLRGAGALRAIAAACLAALAVGAVVAPWTARNARVFHAFVPVATSGGLALWEGNNPRATGLPHDATVEPYPDVRDEAERDRLAGRDAKTYIRENPGRAMSLFFAKLYRTFETDIEVLDSTLSSGRYPWRAALTVLGPLATTYFNAMMLLFCGFLASPLWAGAPRDWRPWGLVVMPVAYFALVQAPFVAQYRYNYPALPFVAIGAAVTLVRAADRMRPPAGTPVGQGFPPPRGGTASRATARPAAVQLMSVNEGGQPCQTS
jgi:4-amino-4-deoxy-L-arabinose transferase-like glycosyltransferase